MNQWGRRLRLEIVGESHGHGVGILLDGVPPGIPVDMAAIQADMDARRPGTGPLVSSRDESDQPRLLSGTHDGHTTGAPLLVWIDNEDTRSKDYSQLRKTPRPGHSDLPARVWSHGFYDHRGGGHYSGRLTAGLVAAAALVRPLLREQGITVGAHLHQVHDQAGPDDPGQVHEDGPADEGGAKHDDARSSAKGGGAGTQDKDRGDGDGGDGGGTILDAATMNERARDSPVHTAHTTMEEAFTKTVEAARSDRDSVGGVVRFRADGVPIAWGDPFFDSVESQLAHILFSVPAVKAVGFGTGHRAAGMHGSEHNDPYTLDPDQMAVPRTNHAGGILGGRTTGAPVWGDVTIKPTSSIFKPQKTVDLDAQEDAVLELKGRHDPCIAIRAVPVIRACVELALVDLLLLARQEGHVRGGAA